MRANEEMLLRRRNESGWKNKGLRNQMRVESKMLRTFSASTIGRRRGYNMRDYEKKEKKKKKKKKT
jgi:hypothetical protein